MTKNMLNAISLISSNKHIVDCYKVFKELAKNMMNAISLVSFIKRLFENFMLEGSNEFFNKVNYFVKNMNF